MTKTQRLKHLMPGIVQIVTYELDLEFLRVNPNHKRVKSPAQEFDESHAKWFESGREC